MGSDEEENVMYDAYDEVASLLQGVAHEINNPVTVVKTNTSNIRQFIEEFEPIIREYAEEHPDAAIGSMDYEEALVRLKSAIDGIQNASGRIKTVVDNFQDFAASGEVEKTKISLDEVVDSALQMADYMIEPVAEVSRDLPEDLPPVDGNRIQLEQVLVNLLTNAVHAIEERQRDEPELEGRIEVDGMVGSENRSVVVTVRDNGTGVPEDIEEKIFAPYVTTKRQGKGFGIGLSKSMGIVEEHNGQLSYQREDRAGAKFVIELPVSESYDEGD